MSTSMSYSDEKKNMNEQATGLVRVDHQVVSLGLKDVPKIPEMLQHVTKVWGKVNNKSFELIGGGVGEPFEGKLNCQLRTTQPLSFDIHLLNVLNMGCPTFSCYQAGTYDLFKISNGYIFEREITYENRGSMKTRHTIKCDNSSKLYNEVEVLEADIGKIPKLVGIEPLVEQFIPAGPGKIRSIMNIVWRKESGGFFTANCVTTYHLNHKVELPWVEYRLIDFLHTKHTETTMDQAEAITVLRSFASLRV